MILNGAGGDTTTPGFHLPEIQKVPRKTTGEFFESLRSFVC
jgi:hypothetical protein